MQDFVPPTPIPSIEEIGVPIVAPVKDGPPDVIPGLLPRAGQLVVAGETNVGKSLVALEICSALTTDHVLWGELVPTMKARKILYILGEHYNEVIQRLWQKTALPMSDQVWLVGPEALGYDKWLVANGKPNPIAINKLSRWAEGADLIIFDPLAAFVTGSEAENDNVQMRLVLDSMSLVAQRTGAASLILAHQGKPQMDRMGKEQSRKTYAIRGASAIEDAATNIFYMDRGASGVEKHQEEVFSLRRRKYKGDAPEEYRLARHPDTLVHTLLGNRPNVEVQKMRTEAMVTRVRRAFPSMPMRDVVHMVCAVTQMSRSTVYNHLNFRSLEEIDAADANRG